MNNPSYPEVIYMVTLKRKRAKEALSQVIDRYGVFSNSPEPGLEVLLDYFNSMVYAIELLLKVLTQDWGPDATAKTRHGHDVSKMYQALFGDRYAKSDLMDELKTAIVDQKFIYEPYRGLVDRVPEIEDLWDTLTTELYKRNWGKVDKVELEVKMPATFAHYLCDHIERFYRSETRRLEHRSREQRIQIHEAHIAYLQREIEQLRNSDETLQQEHQREMGEAMNSYVQKIRSLRLTMNDQLDRVGWELAFGVWTYNFVGGNYLG